MYPTNRRRRWAALALLALLFSTGATSTVLAADREPAPAASEDGTTWVGAAAGASPAAGLHTLGGSLGDEVRARAARCRGVYAGAGGGASLGACWPAVLLAALVLLLVL